MEVAARENATAQKSIGELSGVLQQIALSEKLRESVEFAGRVQYALVTSTGPPGARARNRGVRRAPFIVLIGARMPSILAEIGFISNPEEEAEMRKSEYRDKIAAALYAGIEAYAQSLSKIQASAVPAATAPAAKASQSAKSAAPAAAPRRAVSLKPVVVPTPEASAARRGNGPKPSPARRAGSSGASN